MRNRARIVSAIVAPLLAATAQHPAAAQATLPAPGFHHLHLNSVDPDAAIAFYVRQFPDSAKTIWGGMPALKAKTNVLILFDKVVTPPPADAEATAVWHFGWNVTDVRQKLEFYKSHPEVKLSPMYTTVDGEIVYINSDTIVGTKVQIEEAKAKGGKPNGGPGVMYIAGPDGALIENVGNMPGQVERFNHVHLYQEEPFCAQLWYQKHLNAAVAPALVQNPPRTEADCKVSRGEKTFPALIKGGMYRTPASGVMFDDVAIIWPVSQLERPLASTRGHLVDHFGLSVANLDAWVAKLRAEGVNFLALPYRLGDTRAAMIEGPSHESIELVEVK
jgi:catechol 2,3-dioxygenase-like lactoylglutathione lyase family enzyme